MLSGEARLERALKIQFLPGLCEQAAGERQSAQFLLKGRGCSLPLLGTSEPVGELGAQGIYSLKRSFRRCLCSWKCSLRFVAASGVGEFYFCFVCVLFFFCLFVWWLLCLFGFVVCFEFCVFVFFLLQSNLIHFFFLPL